MGAVSATWTGMDELIARFRDKARLRAALLAELKPLAEEALALVKEFTPRRKEDQFRPDVPHTADLWYLKTLDAPQVGFLITHPFNEGIVTGRPTFERWPEKNLLLILELGTPPHTIEALKAPRVNNAGLLVYFSYRDGHWVKREAVNHPGGPAYRMVGRTEEIVKPKLAPLVQDVLQRFFGDL